MQMTARVVDVVPNASHDIITKFVSKKILRFSYSVWVTSILVYLLSFFYLVEDHLRSGEVKVWKHLKYDNWISNASLTFIHCIKIHLKRAQEPYCFVDVTLGQERSKSETLKNANNSKVSTLDELHVRYLCEFTAASTRTLRDLNFLVEVKDHLGWPWGQSLNSELYH